MIRNLDNNDKDSPKHKYKVLNAVTNEPKISKWGNPNFNFDFISFGRSIFQNLILTASGYIQRDKRNKEPIPLKYIWRRTKQETSIVIKGVTSNSYIPTAEDICYNIEVEAIPIESDIHGSERAFASYGPIYLDLDMKHTLEILLSSENAKFSCFLYNVETQEKKIDKEYLININSSGITLNLRDYDKDEILEFTAFMPGNPRITLHPYDTKRLIIEFYEYEINDESTPNSSPLEKYIVTQKVKGRYDLIIESKQRRELIYLLNQCHVIDDQIKNNKLFSYLNYSELPSDMKLGVTDMMSEIKTLKEENYIFSKNIKIREKEIDQLKSEMRSLEEDFEITLSSINKSVYGIGDEIGSDYVHVNSTTGNGASYKDDKIYNDLKFKYDELRENYSKLSSKEKGISEKNREYLTELEIWKNNINEQKNEIKTLHDKLTEKTAESNAISRSYKILEETNTKLKKEVEKLKEENINLSKTKEEIEVLKTKIGNLSEIEKIKSQLEGDKEKYKKIEFENNSLIQQRDKLAKQNAATLKEFEKLQKEQGKHNELMTNEKDKLSGVQIKLANMEESYGKCFDEKAKLEQIVKKSNADLEILEDKYNTIKSLYDDLYAKSIKNDSVKITKEEYEEYDSLKKEKDETEAIVMQLMTNNNAKDLEIQNLKLQLKK